MFFPYACSLTSSMGRSVIRHCQVCHGLRQMGMEKLLKQRAHDLSVSGCAVVYEIPMIYWGLMSKKWENAIFMPVPFLHFSLFPLSLIQLLLPPSFSRVPWFFSSSSWAAAGITATWTCKLLSPATLTVTAKWQGVVTCTWEVKGCCHITHPLSWQYMETQPDKFLCKLWVPTIKAVFQDWCTSNLD